MRLFVGVTDRQWFEQLSAMSPDEVNFWKPGETASFGALAPGELFLFKLIRNIVIKIIIHKLFKETKNYSRIFSMETITEIKNYLGQ
jgi:hypothetical protein